MAAIITDRFRIKNANDFIESVGEIQTDSLYLFVGRPAEWQDEPELRPEGSAQHSDSNPPPPVDSLVQSTYDHWKDMLGAKKVTTNDVVNVVPRYDWNTTDTDFVPYDPNDGELFRKKFYVLSVDDAGVHNVYKLIERTASGAPVNRPTGTGKNIFHTLDGYYWKYMYTIQTSDVFKFLTEFHMPVRNLKDESGNDDLVSNAAQPNTVDPTFEGELPFPPGGHGSNNIQELGAYFVGINTRLEFGEVVEGDEKITTENDFRKIGLVSNPKLFGQDALATQGPYRQTYSVTINRAGDGQLENYISDEVVQIGQEGASESGIVVFHNNFEDPQKLLLHLEDSDFNTDTNTLVENTEIKGLTSQATGTIASVQTPELEPYSGEIIYIENRKPIQRAADQIEALTIVLEF